MRLRLIGWCLMTNWKVQGVHFIVPLEEAALSHRNLAAEKTSRNCSAHRLVVTAHAQGFFFLPFRAAVIACSFVCSLLVFYLSVI